MSFFIEDIACFLKVIIMALLFSALLKVLLGFLLILLLIFLPAGTIHFMNGWLFISVLFLPMLIAGSVMYLKAPELLKKRLRSKESRKEQSLIVKLSGLMFLLGFIAAGLDFRFSILTLPRGVSYIFSAVFIVFYLLYFEVLRENAYLSRTIEIQENQKVIDTGLYGIVRHPMYTATIFMFLSIPLILGSLLSLLFFLPYPIMIIIRLKDEEKLLESELEGYKKYIHKVKYRLIPFVY